MYFTILHYVIFRFVLTVCGSHIKHSDPSHLLIHLCLPSALATSPPKNKIKENIKENNLVMEVVE